MKSDPRPMDEAVRRAGSGCRVSTTQHSREQPGLVGGLGATAGVARINTMGVMRETQP